MPVVKYKLIQDVNKGYCIPPEIEDGGYWSSPYDDTLLGWAFDYAKFNSPYEWKVMSKEQCVKRALDAHAISPAQKVIGEPGSMDNGIADMTEQEVRDMVEIWYDDIVTRHTTEILELDDIQFDKIKKQKIKQAFNELQDQLDNMTVEYPISSVAANCKFGCDETTIQNVQGVNVAASRNVLSGNDSISWAPKGFSNPVNISVNELTAVGVLLLQKKSDAYNVYFTHKNTIMEANTYADIITYDLCSGYDSI